jgi:hypothetical protein
MISESDIQKAIEPVAFWFDSDGEEGDPMDLVEVVAETAKMLAEERNDCLRLRKALQDIIRLHELIGGRMSQFSAIRAIAQRALEAGAESA